MHPVRNSIKAIIIRNNHLLCVRKMDEQGAYYLLPGGGQKKNETFVEALQRECLEELGASVRVGRLRYIREYIGKNHEFSQEDDGHQVEFMFECELLTEPDLQQATHPDDGQTGIVWVDLAERQKYRVYPKVLTERLVQAYPELYWGDVN